MNVVIELNNSDHHSQYNTKLLSKLAENTIVSSGVFDIDDINIIISVAVVDEAEIKKVNKKLRDKDLVTDVISIGDYSDDINIKDVVDKEIFLGEVILCYNYIEGSAYHNNISVDQEFFIVFVHGILHLLGFNHGEKMLELQEAIVRNFDNNNV